MKQTAILYTRVSTDEQNNGYSPADQKDKLLKYCEQHNIEIVGFYHEDESGTTFDRPQWINIMGYIRKHPHTVDVLLFIKWDRFSRNVAEAYGAIRDLKKYGVEPQAIEQPLNFEVPESKIMLAVYLAAPEVDNDRRALNIHSGIRRAKKEGRWLGGCLLGYKKARDERNKPIIVPEGGLQQQLITEAFKLFATSMYRIEDLRKELKGRGLRISRGPFWTLLRNRGYIGKVFVPAYKDEPAQWVQGVHEPIIEEHTFYQVQDVITGRKKQFPTKWTTVRNELPLRGFLSCPQCGRNLTGSASTGRAGGKFFYYHCTKGCKERQRAKEVNQIFLKVLQRFKIRPEAKELYRLTLKELLQGQNKGNREDIAGIAKELEKLELRLKSAKFLMLDGEFTPEEYRSTKIEIEEAKGDLMAKEKHLREATNDYTAQIDFCLYFLSNLDKCYDIAAPAVKQKIIGSMFPAKLVFANNRYRTTQINDILSLICSNSDVSKEGKKGKHPLSSVLSCEVVSTGIEPASKV